MYKTILSFLIINISLIGSAQKVGKGNIAKTTSKSQTLETVNIGDQIWTTQNLSVNKFRNGDIIPLAKTSEEWEAAGLAEKPAWCYYESIAKNGSKYGKLYNWYAVHDTRGLAPVGYHIPSDSEWDILVENIGGDKIAGKKMKSITGWLNYYGENTCNACKDWSDEYRGGHTCNFCIDSKTVQGLTSGNGTSKFGFLGLPGGARNVNGSFYLNGSDGYWWSSTETNFTLANYRHLYNNKNLVFSYFFSKSSGFSVRCLKD